MKKTHKAFVVIKAKTNELHWFLMCTSECMFFFVCVVYMCMHACFKCTCAVCMCVMCVYVYMCCVWGLCERMCIPSSIHSTPPI